MRLGSLIWWPKRKKEKRNYYIYLVSENKNLLHIFMFFLSPEIYIYSVSDKQNTQSALTRPPLFHLSTQLPTNYTGQPLLHHQPNLTKHQKGHSLFSASTSKALYLHIDRSRTHFSVFSPHENTSFHILKKKTIPSSFKEQHKPKIWNSTDNARRHKTPLWSLKQLNFQFLLILVVYQRERRKTKHDPDCVFVESNELEQSWIDSRWMSLRKYRK